MERTIILNTRYQTFMDYLVGRLADLSEKYEKIEEDLDAGSPLLSSAPLIPMALLDRKFKDLSDNIHLYGCKSIQLILKLRTIDVQLANSDLLAYRSVMLAELDCITRLIVGDIKRKLLFMEDFLDQVKICNQVSSHDHDGFFKEMQDICTEFCQTLDKIIELIITFSKYTSTSLNFLKKSTKNESRNTKLKMAIAHINNQLNEQSAMSVFAC